MDRISDINREYSCLIDDRNGLKIGLLGSFRRDHLTLIRKHLKEDGFSNARISTDLQDDYPQMPDENPKAYNFRLGETLILNSQVLILCFFNQSEGESEINASVEVETGLVYSQYKNNPELRMCVLALYEKGFNEQNIGGMLSGLRETPLDRWQWHEFDDCNEAMLNSKQFCYSCLSYYCS